MLRAYPFGSSSNSSTLFYTCVLFCIFGSHTVSLDFKHFEFLAHCHCIVLASSWFYSPFFVVCHPWYQLLGTVVLSLWLMNSSAGYKVIYKLEM